MRFDMVRPLLPELVCGAVCGASLAAAAAGGLDVAAAGGGAVWAFVGAVAAGGLGGCLVRRAVDAPARTVQEARLADLSARPTVEEHALLTERVSELEGQLSDAQQALAGVSEELAAAQQERERMEEAYASARMTASLDRFSDFQLLAMCEICDAEDEVGYLARPLSDPAMEQLQALGVISFAAAHDGGGELRWTLAPEWRQAVRAHRAEIEERAGALRRRLAADTPSE